MKHPKFKYDTWYKIKKFMANPYKNSFYALLLAYHYFAYEEWKGYDRWL